MSGQSQDIKFGQQNKKLNDLNTEKNFSNDKNIPGMVYIPAGEFIFGTNEGFNYEFPQQRIYLDGFYIDKYEVTNQQYKNFVDATGHPAPLYWKNNTYPKGKDNFPVTNVSYYDALSYSKWAGKRLPTEQEWEKASRYIDGRIYPWGNDWKSNCANIKPIIGFGKLKRVGSFPEGVSKYGCFDMSGNVWEWTQSYFEPYFGNSISNENYGKKYRVIRGGSYRQAESVCQCYRRDFLDPDDSSRPDVGFRCAK